MEEFIFWKIISIIYGLAYNAESFLWAGIGAIGTWAAAIISGVLVYRVIQDAEDRGISEKDNRAPCFLLKYQVAENKDGSKINNGNFILRLRNVGYGPAYDVKVDIESNDQSFRGYLDGTNIFGPEVDEKTLQINIPNKRIHANIFLMHFPKSFITITAADMFRREVVHVFELVNICNSANVSNPGAEVMFKNRFISN